MTGPPASSASTPTNAPHWPSWLGTAPRLVAESLAAVGDPLVAWLRPGPAAPAGQVAAALAHAMLPPAAEDAPPGWLRGDQRLSFQRALAAVRDYRGALLADGVGSGKSWIALAVAQRAGPSRPVIVVAPATLRKQWHAVAGRSGVAIRFHSHELLSRGRTPPAEPGMVIVDESHRFRNPGTRRYGVLAPWCVGRRGLLLSATPAVNRLEDVAHQLLLLIRDDALAWSGVTSLLATLRDRAPGSLARLIVTGEDRSGALPTRRSATLCPDEPAGGVRDELLEGICALRLSRHSAISELIRVSLLLALASSPAAIGAALRRYRLLLLHARDAQQAGSPVSRDAIRRMVAGMTEQLVLWPLAGIGGADGELDLGDLEPVHRLERLARAWSAVPDAKVVALRGAIADGRPSLVFTTALATISYLRTHLERRGVAWCTGRRSGVDQAEVDRDTVLSWFREAQARPHAAFAPPAVLVTTDVAAEGLDLRRVERVVHYDLPWTAVRLEQRAGRALRLGAAQREVELVRFSPAPCIRRRLEQERLLDCKAELPAVLGLGPALNASWRLRARLAHLWEAKAAVEGVATGRGDIPGAVAGFRLRFEDGTVRSVVLARNARGWSDDAATISGILGQVPEEDATSPRPPAELARILRGLAPRIRSALTAAGASHLGASRAAPPVRRARRRLLHMACRASRTRQPQPLAACERGLALLRRGLTAGEIREVARWERLSDTALQQLLGRLPRPDVPPAVSGIDLIGVLAVEPRRRCR